jgi:putative hemolysin
VKSTTVLNYSIELVSIDFNKKEAQIKITPQEPVYACTMDAKICPDGVTYVGRIAPDCNFAPCPDLNTSTEHLCTVEEKSATICTLEYMPVCGKSILNTGAVTYATYGNKCGACAEMKVVSYVPGECVPSVPTNCTSWYDGCNTCFVTDGNIMGCTKKYCEVNTEAYCMQYATDVNPGIANPASTNCIDNNGTLSIVDTNEGQVGMCTLPSGKVCEEWAYLRGECTQ